MGDRGHKLVQHTLHAMICIPAREVKQMELVKKEKDTLLSEN